jgi:hypothetical protein
MKKEDQIKCSANLAFDCVEHIMRVWVCTKIIKAEYGTVFDEAITNVIAKIPIKEGESQYLLYVKIVPYDYICQYPKGENIKSTVTFLTQAVRIVKAAIAKSMKICPKILSEIDFVEEHGTMRPIIVPETYRMYMYENQKMEALVKENNELRSAFNVSHDVASQNLLIESGKKVASQISKIASLEIEINRPEFNKYITEQTDMLQKIDRLGIVCHAE